MANASEPAIRRLVPEDAALLCRFYNGLGERSKRLFQPIGAETDEQRCRLIGEENLIATDTKYDLVAVLADTVVGWAFLWNDPKEAGEATLGIAVSDEVQGTGLGKKLMDALVAAAPARGLRRIRLTVVQDNQIAAHLYETCGFARTGSHVGAEGLSYFSMAKEMK